jgi:FAD/FMN-containing dehydrogenase
MARGPECWGRAFPARHTVLRPAFADGSPAEWGPGRLLPHGLGRSYGDSCLNDGGTLLVTTGLDRFIAFDTKTGVIRCEAGVSFDALLRLVVPKGWFLPVTPGTRFVTVGGALANDVHGKNHHEAGTFGCWVRAFELVRSDGSRLVCTPSANADLFGATIGGLGLTGLVTWVEFQLVPLPSPYFDTESERFGSLDDFFEVNDRSEKTHGYTVAWVDALARGAGLGRGLYMRGNPSAPRAGDRPPGLDLRWSVPADLPSFAMGRATVTAFNAVYYRRQLRRLVRARTSYVPFFYPLDAVGRWNRLYGRRGFHQYQCVLPPQASRDGMREILRLISRSGQGSFLAVLKTFGDRPSPGWLSFPRPGTTLALDFPNRGESTLKLFAELDRVVAATGGALYPAKDGRLPAAQFRAQHPDWERFARLVDPRFSSSFWRRVAQGAA